MAWNEVWEDIFSTRSWGMYPGEDLIRFVARTFSLGEPTQRPEAILEIGCGPGANLWFLAREKFRVFGIDGSASAIAKAQARLDAEFPSWTGEVVVGDFLKLPWADASFEALIDNEAVYCNSFSET